MNLNHFTLETDTDGIALLTWNMSGRSMNIITAQVMDELDTVIDHVVAQASIKGCVIASGKETFSGGADLAMLQDVAQTYAKARITMGEAPAMQQFFDEVRRLSQIYRKLETCGKPFAVAINGLCLGGGFELALACHYRVMADNDTARVGLPEIKIGLFPGAGGSQRVARLMPTGDALQMLFKGEQIRPQQAKLMNLVHELAPAGESVERAKLWIRQGGKAVAPWDDKAFKLPSGKVYSPAGMMIWPPANAIYRRETQDNYPAAKAILHAVYEGLQLPMDLALEVEARYFSHILRSKEAGAMIRTLFVSLTALNKGARRPALPPTRLKTLGVLGAGFMGAGIAYVSASAGLDVILIDRDMAAAERGKAHAAKLLGDQVAKGRMKPAERDAVLARITPGTDYAALAGCDLVVEAVFEDRDIKRGAIQQAEVHLGEGVTFASNTSTLPITSLAENAAKPEHFIGIHFFSPVEKMLLVEIILGEKTSDTALAMAMDFVRMIKKTPIVVNDSRGFYANRCVANYLLEGQLMLMEGIPPAMIENLARQAGMPVGPLSLCDEVAIDLVRKIVLAAKKDLGDTAINPVQDALLETMVVTHGRLGRKNKQGFYDYPESGPKKLWSGLAQVAGQKLVPDTLSKDDIKQRLLVTQALEAARTVEEGVVVDMREADVGSILGFGFAPFTGGTLSYIDGMGTKAFVTLCDRLAAKYGARFAPNPLLRAMAVKGETFYGKFQDKNAM